MNMLTTLMASLLALAGYEYVGQKMDHEKYPPNALQYEIVLFDYADEGMREQLCDMVDNDQEIADLLHFTPEESMRKYLSGPDLEFKTQLLVCRSTDGLSTIYGFIMCSTHDTFMGMHGSVGFVNCIAVRTKYRGYGIAQALLSVFEKMCRENGIAQLLLAVARDNDKAIRVYQRNGFIFKVQEQDCDDENHEIPMIKLLN